MSTASGGVIFDMDGVLVGSGPAHSASWKIVAKRHGITMSDAVFKETFGQRSRDIIHSIWGEGLSDELIQRIDDEKEAAYREMFAGMVPLTIGTRETVAGLRKAAELGRVIDHSSRGSLARSGIRHPQRPDDAAT